VIIGGALWSAWRLWRLHRAGADTTARTGSGPSPRRLALANVVIAFGTLILSAGGVLNSVMNEMDGFAISLVAGITVVFVGFLLTESGSAAHLRAVPEPQEWHARSVTGVA
jgi:hypothetical protein